MAANASGERLSARAALSEPVDSDSPLPTPHARVTQERDRLAEHQLELLSSGDESDITARIEKDVTALRQKLESGG